MLGKERCFEIADAVIKASSADQTEAMVASDDSCLTRFANNYIHQNVAVSDAVVRVRAFIGKKMGVASTNRLTPEGLAEVANRAIEIAELQREMPAFESLPKPQEDAQVSAWHDATAEFTPDLRAQAVRIETEIATAQNCIASGAFSTESGEMALANSLGLRAYVPSTRAEFTTVVMCDTGSGYAYATSRDVDDITPNVIAAGAVQTAVDSRDPVDLEPGEYTVVLSHSAVGEFVDYLAWLGFGARDKQEGRSFMAESMGKKVTGDSVTIWDDALDPTGLPFPFDSEGVRKQKVMLIEDGIARNVVYDTLTAAVDGVESTGHSLGTGWHPYPTNLFMAPGDSSIEEMIAATERGVFVSRFHYTNVSEPMHTVLTGMTRDGTFLIENGVITRPVKNMRFTQSVLGALASADMISADTRIVEGDTRVPAVRVRSFRFSGATVAS